MDGSASGSPNAFLIETREPAMERDIEDSTSDKPDSTGTNARPRETTIAQTGDGIPDDSGRPVQVDDTELKRIADKIRTL